MADDDDGSALLPDVRLWTKADGQGAPRNVWIQRLGAYLCDFRTGYG